MWVVAVAAIGRRITTTVVILDLHPSTRSVRIPLLVPMIDLSVKFIEESRIVGFITFFLSFSNASQATGQNGS